MPISLLQAVAGAGDTTTVALTGVAAGSLLVSDVRVGAIGATVSVSDSVNGAWTLAASQAQTTDGHTGYVFYFPNSAAGNPTITLSASAGTTRLNASEYAGVATSSPVGTTNSAQGAAPLASGSITVPSGDLVFGAATNDNAVLGNWAAGGTSAGGSWATAAEYNAAKHSVYSQYVVASAGGTFASFPTQAAYVNCTSIVVQFKARFALASDTPFVPAGRGAC